ncbi:MAG TPA: exosortase system-associated protein, TIGR04073 family [Candidatus Omnitrophota bacterium]|nr:exosortase system-associated protein, TIGR04073 family [Candidatus Omnitrophota bacterium]
MRRMKGRVFWSLLLAGILLALPLTVWAQASEDSAAVLEGTYSEKISDKLGRGVENLFVGWLEIPYEIRKVSKEKNAWQGATVGFGKGIAYTVGRMATGVYEIVTFPYPQEPIFPLMDSWDW